MELAAMNGGIAALAAVAALIVIAAVWIVAAYNRLVSLRNQVKNGWAQIDVQLKRRYDLIPNLIETAKGYMAHERGTFENVTKARGMCDSAKGPADQAKAENFLTSTLKSLFAVVENYPELKANQNMMALQEELTSTENKIGFARQFYNDMVMTFNTKIEVFPTNVIASMFAFKEAELFELEAASEAKEPPKVKF